MEALEEEQQGEEGHKAWGEVVPEDGEGQARLGHGVPGALDEVLAAERERKAAALDWKLIHGTGENEDAKQLPPFLQPSVVQKRLSS